MLRRAQKNMLSTFQTFAKVNDRHFKTVRQKPRIAPELEDSSASSEQAEVRKNDIYFEEGVVQLEENDEITSSEAAFMRGFLSA
jgi:hypothetical protein